jgi:hypothetical protein
MSAISAPPFAMRGGRQASTGPLRECQRPGFAISNSRPKQLQCQSPGRAAITGSVLAAA